MQEKLDKIKQEIADAKKLPMVLRASRIEKIVDLQIDFLQDVIYKLDTLEER
jgi:hypothetical protein